MLDGASGLEVPMRKCFTFHIAQQREVFNLKWKETVGQ